MPIDSAQYALFKGLIDHVGSKNEVDCGRFLPDAAERLCRGTPKAIVEVIQEDRTHYGNSDCIVIADMKLGLGKWDRVAIVWEIKAPQCLPLEQDDNATRYRPTRNLIKAENQLIHYFNEISNNDDFRRRHGILDRANIKKGGIVIGRTSRLCSGSTSEQKIAENSLYIRRQQIYFPSGFEFLDLG